LCSLALIGLVCLLPAPSGAQTGPDPDYIAPRTPWGDPDIQGVFTSDASNGVGMERRAEFGDRLYVTEEEYQQRVAQAERRAENLEVEFESENARVGTGPPSTFNELFETVSRQTSLVIDPPNGQIPALTPYGESRPRLGEFEPAAPETPEDFTLYIRCITRGVTGSIIPVIYGNGTRIVQAPGYVAIANEMVHEARIIPLDETPFPGENIRMYMGSSRGHWEGETLVVETRNLTDKTGVGLNGGGNRHSEDMILIERFTRTAPDTVYYEATFDDPRTWAAPWTVGFPLVDEPNYQIYEYAACHEGNRQLGHMLSAARAEEAGQ
jgi:hypothetical protein